MKTYILVITQTHSAIFHGDDRPTIAAGLYVDRKKTDPRERDAGLLYISDVDDNLFCVSTRDPNVIILDKSMIDMIRESAL